MDSPETVENWLVLKEGINNKSLDDLAPFTTAQPEEWLSRYRKVKLEYREKLKECKIDILFIPEIEFRECLGVGAKD
jgi:hypothetical protein